MRPILLIVLPLFLFLGAPPVPSASSRGQEAKPKEPAAAPPGGEAGDAILDALIEAHNRIRAEEKLPPLKANDRLTRAARDHARDMADHNKLSHDGSDGSDPGKRIKRAGYVFKGYGENVAEGQETVGEAMRSWIESPPHRENILGDFTEMGGAMAKSADGRNYWCVDLGRPIPPVDPEKSPAALLAALNKVRADAQKRTLKEDAQLARVAARFARDAAMRKTLDGKDKDGKNPFDVLQSEGFRGRRFAMTLAVGEGDPAKVVASWLERPEDRDALLSAFDRAGVGVATDSEGIPYWVILLAQVAGR